MNKKARDLARYKWSAERKSMAVIPAAVAESRNQKLRHVKK